MNIEYAKTKQQIYKAIEKHYNISLEGVAELIKSGGYWWYY